MVEAPATMQTRRLTLRQARDTDVDAIYEYACDSKVTAYAVWPRVTDKRQVHDYLSKVREGWTLGTEFTWFLCEQVASPAIGAVAARVRGSTAELGFILNPRYWNRGYATEATIEVVRWLSTLPNVNRIWATCDTENAASSRVLEKAGLVVEGRVPGGMVRPNISLQPRGAMLYATNRTAA